MSHINTTTIRYPNQKANIFNPTFRSSKQKMSEADIIIDIQKKLSYTYHIKKQAFSKTQI